jgi:hypothetical protein
MWLPLIKRQTSVSKKALQLWKSIQIHLKAHKLSIVQHLTDADKVVRKEFCMQMFYQIQEERFLDSVIFSDESTFHVSGKVNSNNCRICGSKSLHVSLEHVRDSPRWTCFAPSAKSVQPLVLHGADHYRYRVSGHVPTVPHSSVRRRWPTRTHSLPARRRTPSLPWTSVWVPQHKFPRSVD